MAHAIARPRRRGFTLVEVALAVAVGLIIIGGAVVAYNALRESACNLTARDRLLSSQTFIEEFAAANGGLYPTSGTAQFVQMWQTKRPNDCNVNPWGGTTIAQGALERVPLTGGATSATAVALSTVTNGFTEGVADPTMPGIMLYISTTGATWAKATQYGTGTVATAKNYAVFTFNKEGQPYWDVKGGR